jgi:hypothetical protein
MTTDCQIVRPKTFEEDCKARKVKVTIADEHRGTPLADDLRALASAAIAIVLRPTRIGSAELDQEVRGLAERAVGLLANAEFKRLCGEVPCACALSPDGNEIHGRTQ